ncbi:unnamed protein product [Paramecium octaurelia]|uniref:alanine--tRNA ligase n=1 Tax=Paramecium octaurelia TaxID=43137 RepID=A0A8S1T3B0_PAROT|nr:unnamed protein product [Paramecium octaurelia]
MQQKEFEETIEEVKTIKAITPKEIKKIVRPQFEANPELFYPTKVFDKFGFSRCKCPKCGAYFWRHTEKKTTCGDSNCEGKYSFIGVGTGKGAKGNKITYADAWNGFKKSLTSARVPCTAIDRYPVVARWRNDVDYVAAGIYCFQPFCVTGEMDPPANPLICPQFCVRFNDLDNIGLTGRHYSGFIMLGIQTFNYPDKYVFFKEECVEFNYRWLTEELEINPDDITFIEDVWAGGGNLGPSVEYFVNGLEVGNMVFMQYKYFHDGSYEELPIKIIDTGIGLERIPWLVNGSPTSYFDVFAGAFAFLAQKLQVEYSNDVWKAFGPYSCLLNVDEVENVDKTWEFISSQIGYDVQTIKKEIEQLKDMYIILDHTRTVMMVVTDGSLPSNVGGGSNIRNIIRRVFAVLKKNNWWDKLGMDGLLQLFQEHKNDLAKLYGPFGEYKSFDQIIKQEYERWAKTDDDKKVKLEKLLKQKNNQLSIDDWIFAMSTHGIPADTISQISKLPIPGNLYAELADRAARITKAPEAILYNTVHLPETTNLYYQTPKDGKFQAKIVTIFSNVQQQNLPNIVILNQSAFYPFGGGQDFDQGWLTIQGERYYVNNVQKVGKVVLHILEKPLQNAIDTYVGQEVLAEIDLERRTILRNHHTATHIVFAACRRVLGPHVWQNGAHKSVHNAHLDITHFAPLSKEQEQAIENEVNKIILSAKQINKGFMNKADAEKEYGFRLYQGGIVPGNELRVVNIDGIDVEACCGTHCDSTSEVGWVRILKTQKLQDGVVRLYYVAGVKTIEVLNSEGEMINSLVKLWSISKNQLVEEGSKIFQEKKHYESAYNQLKAELIKSQLKYVIDGPNQKTVIQSTEPNPTAYFSEIGKYIQQLKDSKKGLLFVADTFIYGAFGESNFNVDELSKQIEEEGQQLKINKQNKISVKDGKKTIQVNDVLTFSILGKFNKNKASKYLKEQGFVQF